MSYDAILSSKSVIYLHCGIEKSYFQIAVNGDIENTWFGRPLLRPYMVDGVEATHMTVQLLCKSGIQYVFEMIQYIQSECVKWGYA